MMLWCPEGEDFNPALHTHANAVLAGLVVDVRHYRICPVIVITAHVSLTVGTLHHLWTKSV